MESETKEASKAQGVKTRSKRKEVEGEMEEKKGEVEVTQTLTDQSPKASIEDQLQMIMKMMGDMKKQNDDMKSELNDNMMNITKQNDDMKKQNDDMKSELNDNMMNITKQNEDMKSELNKLEDKLGNLRIHIEDKNDELKEEIESVKREINQTKLDMTQGFTNTRLECIKSKEEIEKRIQDMVEDKITMVNQQIIDLRKQVNDNQEEIHGEIQYQIEEKMGQCRDNFLVYVKEQLGDVEEFKDAIDKYQKKIDIQIGDIEKHMDHLKTNQNSSISVNGITELKQQLYNDSQDIKEQCNTNLLKRCQDLEDKLNSNNEMFQQEIDKLNFNQAVMREDQNFISKQVDKRMDKEINKDVANFKFDINKERGRNRDYLSDMAEGSTQDLEDVNIERKELWRTNKEVESAKGTVNKFIIIEKFKGEMGDPPIEYLNNLDEFFLINYLNDNEKIVVATNHLIGSARRWWNALIHKPHSYKQYQDILLSKFWNEEYQDRIRYMVSQEKYRYGMGETFSQFFQRQVCKLKMLTAYPLSDSQIIRIIRHNLPKMVQNILIAADKRTISQTSELLDTVDMNEGTMEDYKNHPGFKGYRDNSSISKSPVLNSKGGMINTIGRPNGRVINNRYEPYRKGYYYKRIKVQNRRNSPNISDESSPKSTPMDSVNLRGPR